MAQAQPLLNVVGIFERPADAGRATHQLAARGFPDDSLTVMSSIPYPDEAFAGGHRRTPLPYISLAGAIAGLLLGVLLAAGTALAYPLATGGKPILWPPSIGVITYETTMLGAIVMTLVGFLVLNRFPRRKPGIYDWRVGDGSIAVVVPCQTEERAAVAEAALASAGAQDITRVARGEKSHGW